LSGRDERRGHNVRRPRDARKNFRGAAPQAGSPTGRRAASNVYSFDEYNRRRAVKKRGGSGSRRSLYIKMLSFLFFTLLTVYIFSYVWTLMSKERVPETRIIMGALDSRETFSGVVVRDEVVYRSPAAGTLLFLAADGERVKPGTPVCGVSDPEESGRIQSELDAIDESIVDMQNLRKGFSIFEKDIAKANAQIKELVDDASHKLSGGGSAVYDLKDAINQKLDLRNKMLLNEEKGSLAGFVRQRQEYEKELNDSVSIISAAEGGVVSYCVDGLEETLTVDSIASLTRERTRAKPESPIFEAGKILAEGDPAFKIIRQNAWYVTAHVPASAVSDWTAGQRKTIYIEDASGFSAFDALVAETEETSKTESRVTFKLTKFLNDFLDKRSVNFKITEEIPEGLKIPNEAIIDKTMLKIPKKYVYQTESTKYSDRYDAVMKRVAAPVGEAPRDEPVIISVSSEDADNVYVLQDISSLKLGDALTNTDSTTDVYRLEDVTSIRGVYVTNSGIPIFKEINFDGLISSNSAYTVVDPAKNPSLKNDDRIIADVRLISTDSSVR
jgi:hypothetical protein